MDFYAFNATPVNGWQTWFATGNDAALALTAAADAHAAASVQFGLGVAALMLAATASPQGAVLGAGLINMTLNALVQPASVAAVTGYADLLLSALYGIPQPPVVTVPTDAKGAWKVPQRYPALTVQADTALRNPRAQRLPAVGPERKL